MKETKIFGSLVRRVAFVFLILVISPLLFYIGYLWNQDWKFTLRAAFSEMETLGDFSSILLEQWYQENKIFLKTISEEQNPSLIQNFSLVLAFDRQFVCTYANQKILEGRADLFPRVLKNAAEWGSLLSINDNPITGKKELFLFQRIGNKIWALSVDLEKWRGIFSHLKEIGYLPTLSFVTKAEEKQKNFTELSLTKLEKLKKRAGIWEAEKLRGKNIGLLVPIANADFDVHILLSSQEMRQYTGGGLFSNVIILLFILMVMGGVGAIWLIRRMERPFHQLYQMMESVRKQNYDQKYAPDRFGFEINLLGENFNQMLADLLQNMEASKELEIGRRVQNQLLPTEEVSFSGLSIGSKFIPAKEVGGDFYDLFPRDKELFLAIADGSDKGVSACLYSLMVRSILRSNALANNSLEEIILKTNALFCHDTGLTGNFVTAFVALYQSDIHELQYSSAGHLPAVFIEPSGNVHEVTTEGIALGVIEIKEIEVKRLTLTPGSLLFLYSDGILDAHNEKGELFGKSRLLEFLFHHRLSEPQMLIDRLIDEVNQFAKDSPQFDDFTVLCLKTH